MSCVICKSKNSFMATAVCGHIFCTSCLVAFIFNHHSDKCPICNVNISKESDARHPPAKMPSNVRIISKEEEIKRGIRKAEPGSSVPALSQRSSSRGPTRPVPAKKTAAPKALPRDPGEDASEFEKAKYLRAVIMKKFNDGDVNFFKPDGSALVAKEYREIAREAREDPETYYQGKMLSFDDEDSVYIPRYVSAEKEAKVHTKKVTAKPVPRDPGENAEDVEKALFLRKKIMKDFNDNKTHFLKPDGSVLTLNEYHKIAKLAKDDPEAYYRGEMQEFMIPNEDENDESELEVRKVYIPEFVEQPQSNPSDLLSKMKKNATKTVAKKSLDESEDEAPASPKATAPASPKAKAKKSLDDSDNEAPASPKPKAVSKKQIKASTSDDEA